MGRKLLASLMAMGIVLTSLTGCSGNTTPSSTPTPSGTEGTPAATESASPSTDPVTVEFWTISLQPTFTDFFNGLIADYQTANSNVTVKWVDLPYDSIQQKLIASSAGGASPDVVNLNTQMALSLAGKGALVDLNKEATEEQRSIYLDSLYDSARIGDSVYAFPWYASPSIMVYNKALFEQAGLTTTPKTFEEANSMAKTMMEKTGAYLYMPGQLSTQMFLEDISILNETKTQAAFNTPEAISLLTKYRELVDQGVLSKTSWGEWNDQLKLFATSKLAIINSSGSSINRIKDEAPDVYANIGIAQPMTGSAGFVSNPLMNVVVPEKSKNHEAAIAFANFITNDASQLAFCKEVAIFPSTKAAAADPYFREDSTTLQGIARGISADILGNSKDFSLGIEKQDEITKQINLIYEACIMSNEDITQKFTQTETEVNNILSK